MNIAIFTHNYPKNKDDRKDAGIFVHDFANELSKKHKVFIFCPDYGNSKKFGNWSIFNPLSAFNFFSNIFFGIKESLKFVKKNKIDYILCAWAIPSGIYALFAKLKYGTRYGVWYLGSDLNIYSKYPILSTLISILSKKADNLFANSFALAKMATKKYKKCLMLPASTKVEENSRLTEKVKLNSKKINILYVGRLERVKGPDLLVKASKKLSSKFVIRVIGEGTMRNQLEGLSENVQFLGYLGLAEMTSYMASSDFLIIPSRNESLPLVILEAANYKLPVLASDVGDSKYVLNKYNIGDVFKKNDINDMSTKIKKFKYKKFKTSGRFKDLAVNYSLDTSVDRFLRNI